MDVKLQPISKFHFYSLFDLVSSVDIGLVTRATLNSLVQSGDVSTHKEKTFYEGAKAFFLVAFEYSIERMPVDDPLLQNAQFVHFEDRINISFSMRQYFVQRYGIIF